MPPSNVPSNIEQLCDFLSANPCLKCRHCGSVMVQVNAAFCTAEPDGRSWSVRLPLCPQCGLDEETAQFIPAAEC